MVNVFCKIQNCESLIKNLLSWDTQYHSWLIKNKSLLNIFLLYTLREKSVGIQSFSGSNFPAFGLSVFSPNTGKNRPERTRILTPFTQWLVLQTKGKHTFNTLITISYPAFSTFTLSVYTFCMGIALGTLVNCH